MPTFGEAIDQKRYVEISDFLPTTLFLMIANVHPVVASPSVIVNTFHTSMQLPRIAPSGYIRWRLPLELQANLP